MMRICICEDDAFARESIQQGIKRWMQITNNFDIELHTFCSSEELLKQWSQNLCVHLFFLDVIFPHEMSGLDLAHTIRARNPDVPIVFVSNYEKYVYHGYRFRALRFLKKPISEVELFSCLDIAYDHYTLFHQDRAVLSIPEAQLAVRHAEILYIEAHSPAVAIVTLHSKEPLIIRYRLAKLLDMLPPSLFASCHRSYIVNVAHIRLLKNAQLLLTNGATLPVSKKYESAIFHMFNHFHREMLLPE